MFKRYSLYYLPKGQLAEFGANWLGWDIQNGCVVDKKSQILPSKLLYLVETPRKYGFHATLKAPFSLKQNYTIEDLKNRTRSIAEAYPRFIFQGEISSLNEFLAIRCQLQDPIVLQNIAADCVRGLEKTRAPLTQAQKEKRLKAQLTPAQLVYLEGFGYPYIFDEFRFHLTLTNKITEKEKNALDPILKTHLLPILEKPIEFNTICLTGEREDGQFELIETFPLGPQSTS